MSKKKQSPEREAWQAEEERQLEVAEEARKAVTSKQFDKVFKPYKAPKGVIGKDGQGIVGDAAPGCLPPSLGMGMAMMDPSLAQMAHEGIGFPGYPYLSMLSMRGEYRNIVGTRSREFFRKWGQFRSKSGDSDSIKERADKIEAEMERLKVRETLHLQFVHDEFFGMGNAIVLMEGDEDDEVELASDFALTPEKLKNRKIDAFRVVEPTWMTPDWYEARKPLQEGFYKPQAWWVMGTKVHASRVKQIISRPLPTLLRPAFNFGGVPITLMARPYVQNWLRTRQNVSDILATLRVFVVNTDIAAASGGVRTQQAPGGSGRTIKAALRRFQENMDNFGILCLPTGSSMDTKSTPLAGLEELNAQALEQICSITNIPVIKFTTNQPAGLNANSDGTIRTFYDTGRSVRENDIGPALNWMVNIIQLSLFGDVDDDIEWVWDDLYEETPKDKLEMEESKARIRASDVAIGAINGDEAREQIRGDDDSIYSDANVDLTGAAPETADYPGGTDAESLTSGSLALPPEKLEKTRAATNSSTP